MKKKETEKISIFILTGFMCMWLILALMTVPKLYGPIILPDEFGYWAQAANLAGMDWQEAMTQHSWYSFGYGLLMLPLLELVPHPIVRYRCMVGFHFLLLGAATLLLYRILTRLGKGKEKKLAAWISGMALTYVAYISYAQTTMTEVLLVFLYILLAYFLYRWLMQPDIRKSIPVLFTGGYMYMVHMRTVGILLTTAVCMIAVLLCGKEPGKRKRKAAIVISVVILGVILALFITEAVKGYLVSGAASEEYRRLTQTNDYGGQWSKLGYLFTLKGIYRFFTGLAGKIFYMGCASFGLYYWGMAFLLKKGKKLIKSLIRKESVPNEAWLYCFILLSHTAAVLISNIFGLMSNRLDAVLYGRYHENTLPFILAFGMVEIISAPKVKKRLLWFMGLTNISFFLVYSLLGNGTIVYLNRHSILGILYAVVLADNYDAKLLLYAGLGGALGMAVMLALARLAEGRKKQVFFWGIALLQLLPALVAWKYYLQPAHAGQKADVEMLSELQKKAEIQVEAEVLYSYSEKDNAYCLVQYMLQDISLHIVSREELRETDKKTFVVLQRGDELAEEMPAQYTEVLESPHYVVFCNWEERDNVCYP